MNIGKPIQKIVIGETEIPQEIFEDYMTAIAYKYTIHKYDVISNNCNMFTNQAAQFLTGQGIDEKYYNQAKQALKSSLGPMIKPYLDRASEQLRTQWLNDD